mmetsp:Transcript_6259/g.9214  ORF Transcript_6259/g.9214 Transcript_6259/m.9214 type:complete len:237 (+) Transcript_6259:458-1168(+)|eukprot:CAMPEP_0194205446 /NCGR_PEP_ID=MMETSP0156-20130528/4714_1 /TAXON_ID=33649 /ORGANISM="Thalassionema nitzschioides, Strain L26-B" /LENGTH=236 /DNA_ID=CAMNT_0038931715 /DNA_START=402 /DNA_END=1112 /DNA_ORIENTATION=-
MENNKSFDENGGANADAKIFPLKLMEIVSDPENSDSITWDSDGKIFMIINRQKFAKDVLPKYYPKSKYFSFTHKLNRWNFIRLSCGRHQSSYYHEFFQKGQIALCTQMYCNNNRAKFAESTKKTRSSELKSIDLPQATAGSRNCFEYAAPSALISTPSFPDKASPFDIYVSSDRVLPSIYEQKADIIKSSLLDYEIVKQKILEDQAKQFHLQLAMTQRELSPLLESSQVALLGRYL